MKKMAGLIIFIAALSLISCGGGGGGGGDTSSSGNINTPLIANAGNDQYVAQNDVVNLNGSNNSGINNAKLTYTWSFSSKPIGSNAAFSSLSSATPTFIADKVGVYVVSLVVNDGTQNSINTSTVSITVVFTNSFQFPFKIANWNVQQGRNIYGNNGCSIFNDPVEFTTADNIYNDSVELKTEAATVYSTGFAAYTGSPFLIPPPGTYNTIIGIIPYYNGLGRSLRSGEFTGTYIYSEEKKGYVYVYTYFQVDNGPTYMYDGLDLSQESINNFLATMAAGQTLNYQYVTNLVYYPIIKKSVPLAGFNIAKKAFEYCITNFPNGTITAPITPPPTSRFVNNGNGTVTDTQTGLMWADRDNGSVLSWLNAKNYCDGYNGGGVSGWRMPTSNELKGLYDAGAYGRQIVITGWGVWASETTSSSTAYFNFYYGGQGWYLTSPGAFGTALPVRSSK